MNISNQPHLNSKYFVPSYVPNAELISVPVRGERVDKKLPKQQKLKNATKDSSTVNSEFVIFLLLLALTFQFVLATGSYSGNGDAPMYGDYEAQRHWMEITYNLPIREWYRNTTNNDLMYWGLDYPPLTAYHSWIMGAIAHRLNPEWVSLFSSRGIETTAHKLFMRIMAILPFYIFYFPALIAIIKRAKSSSIDKNSLLFLGLLYPGLLAIDNGHFQFNSISLGLFLLSYNSLSQSALLMGSLYFVAAVNYKQMELYHSLPIFVFILARCIQKPFFSSLISTFVNVAKVGIVVVGCFAIVWLPFLLNGIDDVAILLRRIFPFYRGLFEDKVANFWCSISVAVKMNKIISVDGQIKLSTLMVLLNSLPSLLLLFRRPSERNLRLALFIVSLCFFLFSFQVHEKSILLPAISAIVLLADYPLEAAWFLCISNASMFSLCIKDNTRLVLVPFIAYIICITRTVRIENSYVNVLRYLSLMGSVVICIFELSITPPKSLPHLFPLLNAVYSCGHFLLFFVYFYYQMAKSELFGESTKKTN